MLTHAKRERLSNEWKDWGQVTVLNADAIVETVNFICEEFNFGYVDIIITIGVATTFIISTKK